MENKIRAVNLGGWFVLERWIKPSLFKDNFVDGKDETCFCEQVKNKEQILYDHYNTFITRDDIVWLKNQGINLVRIPIPWWLYGDAPYVRSVKHLDKALEMISEEGMNFMLDLHTAPGCQNGFDNGGIEGVINWHKDQNNIDKTVDVLEKIALRYKNYPHFHSLGILNEPHFDTDLNIIKQFYLDAYRRVRPILQHQELVFHDAFRLHEWEGFFKNNHLENVVLDAHIYQCFGKGDFDLTIDEHLQRALERNVRLEKVEKYVRVLVGEWSLGLRFNEYINQENMTEVMSKYALAQIKGMRDNYGHAFWNYKVEDYESGWNFRGLVERKIINLKEFLK